MTWPPPRPDEPEVPHRPWDPRRRGALWLVKEHDRVVYVVVDETVGGWMGLSVSAWPHADHDGRLRFVDPEGSVEVGTSADALLQFLGTGKLFDPKTEVRIGFTFAARVRRGSAASLLAKLRDRAGHGEARIADLGEFLKDPVDLTEEGRLLAKLASFGAMASTVPEELAQKWRRGEKK